MNSVCYKFFSLFLIFFLCLSCGVNKGLKVLPAISIYDTVAPSVIKLTNSTSLSSNAFLLKNKQQLWELYVAGDPYQIGLKTGALTQNLYQKQETVFFSKVEEIVPGGFRQKMLIKMLKFYNRHLYRYIPEEYQTEIFGISKYATNRFDYLGDAFHRNLYLHGAHDIGHAFQDLALVGCTSLAVWGKNSEDGGLLIGRNFDFYAGDAFAENKVVSFVKPDIGNAYMSYSWPGMIGVVSGMNEKGLTVTLNAGKSTIPLKAKTPISIVAREILQYASNIEEAIAIAKDKEVFVSESLLIGSAEDKKAIIIEIAPHKMGVYEMPNSSSLICSNHFQSDAFADDKRNRKHIEESHSKYRWDKMNELLEEEEKLSPKKMVEILRNTEGLNNKKIGYGNEKALNQLLAHHGIVFQPEKRMVWVSSSPYQLGTFVAYDLNEVFKKPFDKAISFSIDSLSIEKSPFLYTAAFLDYEKFRMEDRIIESAINKEEVLSTEVIKDYQRLNPEYWLVYYRAGVYFYNNKQYEEAEKQFKIALEKEVTTKVAVTKIEEYLKKISKKWKGNRL